MTRATQPVSINDISFDALIESSEGLESEVPNYPVETGFWINDSIILRPRKLSMTLFLTNTPVTWRARHGSNPFRVQDVIEKLEELYFSREPVTVSTGEKIYEKMAITTCELPKKKDTGSAMEIPIEFEEIRITESQTTTIPDEYGKSGKTGTNAGAANTTSKAPPSGTAAGEKEGKGDTILMGGYNKKYGSATASGLMK